MMKEIFFEIIQIDWSAAIYVILYGLCVEFMS